MLTLSLPVTRICVNFSTVYNDTLVGKGLMSWIIGYDKRMSRSCKGHVEVTSKSWQGHLRSDLSC